ncbi:unnamed protein product [Spirodela intermedia]|uniref:Protein kinase domain-containing protein n=1 Tax=Spirodela intermedia TaxID=51605 RepID=A0A7I8IUL8_SPIIN|nr:unnamed protein product [Spirodela intermedia]CAA6661469.1 unnamed protein product [Spirodela intermedia]
MAATGAAAAAAEELMVAAMLVLGMAMAPSAVVCGEDGVRCLRGVKDALGDSQGRLSSTWHFGNSSVAFICSFVGVSCWNFQENRVLELRLQSMGLAGEIPSALQYCTSTTTLDLSGNALSGPIPPGLCKWLPYLVHLDLSGNELSGAIPPDLFSRLPRLKRFAVSRNSLSGPIPQGFAAFNPADFEGNSGLCGRPLGSRCGGGLSRRSLIIIIAAGAFAAASSALLAFGIWRRWVVHPAQRRRGAAKEEQCSWVERLKYHRLAQVSLFQKPIVKLKIADLMAATNEFNPGNIISVSARAGTSYRAVLCDGSALSVKRLHACTLSEKQFRSEIGHLGQLRHPNLVPLLGYCVVENERLLVYKHIPNGSLFTRLHSVTAPLDWPARLKIGIGAARGLAWLHHGIHPPLIHQSLSTRVILLNEDNEPRITDFGLAALAGRAGDSASTSPFVNGDLSDIGYLAPEYSTITVPSLKGDVYGFGVILLELVTGQKPLEVVGNAGEIFKGNVVDWVNQFSIAGQMSDVVDQSIRGTGDDGEILQVLKIARRCVTSRPKERIPMHQVYQSLKVIGETHEFSEQFDDFPLIYGKDDPEAQ